MLTLIIRSRSTEGQQISAEYLARLCAGFQKLETLHVEDVSTDFDEDIYRIISKIKTPERLEVRSEKSESNLKVADNTLVHLASSNRKLDVVALSTNKSKFGLKAVQTFLENAVFAENCFVELYYIDCTIEEFIKLLDDMRISYVSEPTRSVYNCFPIVVKGRPVIFNVKFFSDSNGKRR